MTTFTVQSVAAGFLPNPQAAIFTAAAVTYIKKLDLFNPNATTQTIQLFLVPVGSSASPWKRLALGQNESADILEQGESLTLGVGDSIEALATTDAVVAWSLTSVNEA